MARRLAIATTTVLVVVTSFVVGGLAVGVGTAGAQAPATTTTLVPIDEQPLSSPSIIPTPNSNGQPTQYLVMAAVVLGLATIGLLVYRESRKNAANRTHKPA